jgi:hypothetical protein
LSWDTLHGFPFKTSDTVVMETPVMPAISLSVIRN